MWDLEGIVTAEKVESFDYAKKTSLEREVPFPMVEVPADMIGVVVLANQRLDSERKVSKGNRRLLGWNGSCRSQAALHDLLSTVL